MHGKLIARNLMVIACEILWFPTTNEYTTDWKYMIKQEQIPGIYVTLIVHMTHNNAAIEISIVW